MPEPMLGELTNEADPTGSTYAFEKSVTKGPPARQKIESKRAGWRFEVRISERRSYGALISRASDKWMGLLIWWKPFKADDVATLKELIAAGKVTPVIDRRFPLSEVVDARVGGDDEEEQPTGRGFADDDGSRLTGRMVRIGPRSRKLFEDCLDRLIDRRLLPAIRLRRAAPGPVTPSLISLAHG